MCKTCKTCFLGGTQIKIGELIIPIEDVENVLKSESNSIAIIKLDGEISRHEIKVTPNHLIKTSSKGYVRVIDLEIGDSIENINNEKIIVGEVIIHKGITPKLVYTLDFEGEDIIVGNLGVLFADYTRMSNEIIV